MYTLLTTRKSMSFVYVCMYALAFIYMSMPPCTRVRVCIHFVYMCVCGNLRFCGSVFASVSMNLPVCIHVRVCVSAYVCVNLCACAALCLSCLCGRPLSPDEKFTCTCFVLCVVFMHFSLSSLSFVHVL